MTPRGTGALYCNGSVHVRQRGLASGLPPGHQPVGQIAPSRQLSVKTAPIPAKNIPDVGAKPGIKLASISIQPQLTA